MEYRYFKTLDRKSVSGRQAFDSAAAAMISGKVAVLPTDTIYGLSCRADDKAAIARIYKIKGRDKDKPLLILVSSLAMAGRYVRIPSSAQARVRRIWQEDSRPTTLIFKKKKVLPEELARGRDSLAVRLPKSDFLIRMIRKTGVPLVSTSLNASGQPDIKDVSRLEDHFPASRRPDLVIDNGRPRRQRSSRLIDLSGPQAVVIRK